MPEAICMICHRMFVVDFETSGRYICFECYREYDITIDRGDE